MSEQEGEEHNAWYDAAGEAVEKGTAPVEKLNQVVSMSNMPGKSWTQEAHGLELPKGAEGALGVFNVYNGIRGMAEAKDPRHFVGSAVDTAGGGLGLAGALSSAEWIPGAGQVIGAAGAGMSIANAGLDEVERTGMFGKRTEEGAKFTGSNLYSGKDENGKLVRANRDFIDVGVDTGRDFNHSVRDATGSELLGDIAGGIGGTLGTIGAGAATVGAGIWSGIKSIGSMFADPMGAGEMRKKMEQQLAQKRAEQQAVQEEVERQKQRGADVQVGSSLAGLAQNQMAAAMQMPEGPARDGMLQAAKAMQHAGIDRIKGEEQVQRERAADLQVGGSLVGTAQNQMAMAMQMPEGPARDGMMQAAKAMQTAALSRMKGETPEDAASPAPAAPEQNSSQPGPNACVEPVSSQPANVVEAQS